MRRFRATLVRLGNLFRRQRHERELAEELESHLQMHIEDNLRSGMTPAEARRQALIRLGGLEQVKEECRDRWSVRILNELAQDLRYGLRQLRRNPGFTAVAVITLALGIGANTAIFSIVNTVLLRPLPYKDPGRLVWAAERFGFVHAGAVVVSPDFIAWRRENNVFHQIGASNGGSGANLTGAGEPVRVNVMKVTAGLFPMLGVRPIFGRGFSSDEDSQKHDQLALLSDGLWRTRFGARRDVLGKVIDLDNHPYTVVGVMPGNLKYPSADVWTPMALDGPRFSPRSPNWQILTVIARLKPGVTPTQAKSNLRLITERMNSQYPPQAASFRAHVKVEVVPLHELFVKNVRLLLVVLLAAVGFVLLIACANVANLLLSRTAARSREFAVRAAMGAGRARLIRQLLTECAMLAAAGGVLGLCAGLGAVRLLKRLVPPNLPSEVGLDPRLFFFVAIIALIAVMLFALPPALASSRTGISNSLKASSVVSGTGTHRLRRFLVVGEVALSLVLLAGAGLLTASFVRLSNVKLGFDPHHVLTASIWRSVTPAVSDSEQAAFFHEVLQKVRAIPRVQQAAVTTHLPLSIFNDLTARLSVQGSGMVRLPLPISVTSISADYFRTMRIRLLKGRFFSKHDTQGEPSVVIINHTLAREVFKGRDPVGNQISSVSPKGPWKTVVGMVADASNYRLGQQPWPEMFEPYFQQPRYFMTLAIRTSGEPLAVVDAVRKAAHSVDKNQPISNVHSMEEEVEKASAPQRFRAQILGLFALLALALAAVGVFGVMAYWVSERTNEIGIRMALGAEKWDVLRMVVRQGIKLILVGLALGITGALALTRFLASMLYGVKPTDPLTFIVVSLILVVVALLACYIPARRAAKVDPMVALRYE